MQAILNDLYMHRTIPFYDAKKCTFGGGNIHIYNYDWFPVMYIETNKTL